MTPLTPEQRAARARGKLDARCRDCGATSAASARCYACQSANVDYFTHAENGGKCVAGAGGGEVSEETRQKRREAALLQHGKVHQTPLTDPAPPTPLSAAGSGAGLTLWGAS